MDLREDPEWYTVRKYVQIIAKYFYEIPKFLHTL